MITTELIDPEEASEVLDDPRIFEVITDDHCPDKIEWPSDCTYIGGYVNREIASVCIAHHTERGYQYHVQILPEYREHKDELLEQALEMALDMYGTLWCEIPDLYPNVLKVAKDFGFREVETLKDNYLKNGVLYDSRILEI